MKSRLTPDHHAQLEALRRAYEEDLPRRVREVVDAMAALQGPVPRPDALETAYHLVHRLSGSSAIYGFDAVRRPAAELDRLLARAMEERATDGLDASLAVHLEELRRAVAVKRPEGERG
jgi:HPt (histidine-containing phosphotransfer) domain-containing protein